MFAVCAMPLAADTINDVAVSQIPEYKYLTSISKFSTLHTNNSQDDKDRTENIKLLFKLIKYSYSQSDEILPENIESLVDASKIAFDGSDTNISFVAKKAYAILSFAGKHLDRMSSKRIKNRPFYKHIIDAIAVNKARKPYYSKMSGSRSEIVSNKLIAFEYSIIPVALIIDRLALKFHKKGIPIIKDDFVDMINIPCASEPISLSGHLSESEMSYYFALMATYKKDIMKLSRQHKFVEIENLSKRCLAQLYEFEVSSNNSFAMGKHVVESIQLSASNAIKYQMASNGKTDQLASANILLQAIGVNVFAELDVLSSPIHEAGVGILINDLPKILTNH